MPWPQHSSRAAASRAASKRRKPNRRFPAPLLLLLAWYSSVMLWASMPEPLRNLLLLCLCISEPCAGDTQRWTLRTLQRCGYAEESKMMTGGQHQE